ncbi:MAG: MFS transporter [Candidatus Heimdallarchaeota archaeon]|nr:MFS transporter [Candidatus Heimdallarchaeota archaeon]
MAKSNYYLILIASAFFGFITGSSRFLVPIALVEYGWSIQDYGAVFVFQALSMALPHILGGFYSDLKGRKQTIQLAYLFAVLGSIIFMYYLSSSSLFVIIIGQMAITISGGLSRIGLSTIVVDEASEKQRTSKLGDQFAIMQLLASIGPMIFGIALVENLLGLKFIFSVFSKDTISTSFYILSIIAIIGIFLASGLPETPQEQIDQNKQMKLSDFSESQKKMQYSFVFSEILVGFFSGAIVPFIDFYILNEYDPSKDVWGIVFGLSNSTIALGAFMVGRNAENYGKGKTVILLYAFAPVLALGIALSPTFIGVSIFYILRSGVANASNPAWTSWYFTHTIDTAKGRGLSTIQITRRLGRSAGVGFGPILFATFGVMSFPLSCIFYPLVTLVPYLNEKKINK